MGTRLRCASCTAYFKDHPHAYGDKSLLHSTHNSFTGSSPRVWGQAITFDFPFISCRIIPTRMGTRTERYEINISCEDHPHAYGDKFQSVCFGGFLKGSSPRVWGQVLRFRQAVAKTQDHPHAYGDKTQ